MPLYDYHCTACNEYITDIHLTMAQRDIPVSEPCPLCNAEHSIERVITSPAFGDAFRLGRTHLPSSWTDKLAQIKSKHRRSTIHVPTPGKREL